MTGPTTAAGTTARLQAATTVAEAQRALAARFAAANVEAPALAARLLIEAVTGASREQLAMSPGRRLTAAELERLEGFAARHLAHEPVTRILGRRDFWRHTFEITPDTLDPRPDTETLVELALDVVREAGRQAGPLRILDIGTGSGCILIALLGELPGASGVGSDINPGALTVAAGNAARIGVAGRAQWCRADVLNGISGRFDLIVSNPPYIPAADIAGLGVAVRCHDPLAALDGGSDGLDFYRRITAGAAAAISPGGWCVMEVGAGQAEAVAALAAGAAGGVVEVRQRRDLGGHTRCVAWKPRC